VLTFTVMTIIFKLASKLIFIFLRYTLRWSIKKREEKRKM